MNCLNLIDFIGNTLLLLNQGLPSVGANAGAGNLDFLRNSPQVHITYASF